ncbi:MAG: type II secretion system F family protein [Candidatus Zixiibacteriota bacterium]
MPKTFSYMARTFDGQKQEGFIQAESRNRVADILSEQNLIPTEIKLKATSMKPGIFGFMKGRLYEDLIVFTRNLSTLYRAGIPILRALSIIKIGAPDSYFNKAITNVRESVKLGRSLADSLYDYPRVFPKVYAASIAAGEQSGKIDEILDSLAIMLEKDLELNRQIKSSVRYPLSVVSAIALAFIVLFTFVIPRFMQFYSKMGVDLPLPTKILIWINTAITSYWHVSIVAVIALIIGLKYFISRPRGKEIIDSLILKMPIFGDLILKGTVARFAYIFQILIKSGIPMVKALEMIVDIVKNSKIAQEIRDMADSFRGGRELTVIIDKKQYFPEMAIQMIKVGLESGSLDVMMSEIANHYSKEVDYKSRQLTSLLETILTIVLGVFILIVALAIFLPMWNLIQVFKG